MLDDEQIEAQVRVLMYELMMVLYRHGITEVHVGGLMRVLGVHDATASEHDNEMVVLDDKFAKYVEQMFEPRTSNKTLH